MEEIPHHLTIIIRNNIQTHQNEKIKITCIEL
jgi:hypothetical protein